MLRSNRAPIPPCRASRPTAGYTVLEVMIALAVLAIGAAGIVAMQKGTLLGNTNARNLATANAIAATWAERLRADGLQWTEVAGQNTILTTKWLKDAGNHFPTITSPEGTWIRPAGDAGATDGDNGVSYQANVQGLDTTVEGAAAFCTNIRLVQLLPTLIRAEIRVFWLRTQGKGNVVANEFCPAGSLDTIGKARDRYHFVYLTTAILRNDSTR
jgi:prepilin-type N-terminal cleavage/methylation domain-containing protein